VNAFLSWADEFYLRPHHRSAALLHPSTVDTPRHRLERLGARRTGRGALERGDGVFDPEVAAILTSSG
jgi:hypothetical protein